MRIEYYLRKHFHACELHPHKIDKSKPNINLSKSLSECFINATPSRLIAYVYSTVRSAFIIKLSAEIVSWIRETIELLNQQRTLRIITSEIANDIFRPLCFSLYHSGWLTNLVSVLIVPFVIRTIGGAVLTRSRLLSSRNNNDKAKVGSYPACCFEVTRAIWGNLIWKGFR